MASTYQPRSLVRWLAVWAVLGALGCGPTLQEYRARTEQLERENIESRLRAVSEYLRAHGLAITHIELHEFSWPSEEAREQETCALESMDPPDGQVTVSVRCDDIDHHIPPRLIEATLASGEPAVMVFEGGADGGPPSAPGLLFARDADQVIVIRPVSHSVRRETVTQPGECNLMPSGSVYEPPHPYFLLRGSRPSAVQIVDVPYDVVVIDRTCESPIY